MNETIRVKRRAKLIGEAVESYLNQGGGGGQPYTAGENGLSPSQNIAANLNAARKFLTKIKSQNRAPTIDEAEYLRRLTLGEQVSPPKPTIDVLALQRAANKVPPEDWFLPMGKQLELDQPRYNQIADLQLRHYRHTLAINLVDPLKPGSEEIQRLIMARDQIEQAIRVLVWSFQKEYKNELK